MKNLGYNINIMNESGVIIASGNKKHNKQDISSYVTIKYLYPRNKIYVLFYNGCIKNNW
ncbi:sugar diacid recognition domain-containing protein [Vallitalea sp.]|uniref:sugar diacid recognition domain-containing protein n=1 Tax=Vallitalea sp. TaxID=1882829 RepID=UPI003FCE0371